MCVLERIGAFSEGITLQEKMFSCIEQSALGIHNLSKY
jgi:hypothetical protein